MPADGDAYFTNAVDRASSRAANGAWTHYKLQQESATAFHIAQRRGGSRARQPLALALAFALGGALGAHRHRHAARRARAPTARSTGSTWPTARSTSTTTPRIDHAQAARHQPRALQGHPRRARARGVFNGKVIVRPDAQKTDAQQTNQNLLLSDDAEIDTKPQLEIFADDVKCSHGATIGQLDEDAIFYLRSRGIDDDAGARAC